MKTRNQDRQLFRVINRLIKVASPMVRFTNHRIYRSVPLQPWWRCNECVCLSVCLSPAVLPPAEEVCLAEYRLVYSVTKFQSTL